jgi:hypothetical protein
VDKGENYTQSIVFLERARLLLLIYINTTGMMNLKNSLTCYGKTALILTALSTTQTEE